MTDQEHPLRLAAGSHREGSGKGCVMNVISWQSGDTTITDMPDCVDPFLARVAQQLNDRICMHRDGDLLCPDCSQIVLEFGHRVVGTAGAATPADYGHIAVALARRVAHLNDDPRVEAALVAAEVCLADQADAADAADAAVAYAAYDAYADAAAYDAADAAYDAAAAAYDADAGYAAAGYAADSARVAARAAQLAAANTALETWAAQTGWQPATWQPALDLDDAINLMQTVR